MTGPRAPALTVVPANEASCDDLQAVFGTGFRGRGIAYALAEAAVDFARSRGARAIEGYPLLTQPGQRISWDEIHVGSRSIFDRRLRRNQPSDPPPGRAAHRALASERARAIP